MKCTQKITGLLAAITPILVHANALGGAGEISGISGDADGVRTSVRDILITILSYVGLAAVVTIVIAGILLIVGAGSDNSRDRAKNIIIYTSVGLLVLLFASAIVGFFISL